MTNPAHQPAPENVSKKLSSEVQIAELVNAIEGIYAMDWPHPKILREVHQTIEVHKLLWKQRSERLNAQKDALIVGLRGVLAGVRGQNPTYFKRDDFGQEVPAGNRPTFAQDRIDEALAYTADSYAGKVVLDAEAVGKVRRAIERSRNGWDVLARSDEGTGGMEDEVVRLTRALALLDAPTANPENGKDGK